MDGLIVKALSGFYYVQTEEGAVIECRARGKLRKTQMSPLVGDRVTIAVESGKGTVQEVLPRRNRFVRPAVVPHRPDYGHCRPPECAGDSLRQ